MAEETTIDGSGAAAEEAAAPQTRRERLRRTRRLMREARSHLTHRALRLIGFVVFVYLVLKLIPGFEKALTSLQNVKFQWVIGAMAVETLSEIGYVVSWRGILDPDNLLRQDGRGKHLGARVAWAQLGGGNAANTVNSGRIFVNLRSKPERQDSALQVIARLRRATAGVPGINISFWHGLWAPTGTPQEIVNKLNAALAAALADATVRKRLTDIGQEIVPRDKQTPEALHAFHKAEIEKWWPIIKAANIKAE